MSDRVDDIEVQLTSDEGPVQVADEEQGGDIFDMAILNPVRQPISTRVVLPLTEVEPGETVGETITNVFSRARTQVRDKVSGLDGMALEGIHLQWNRFSGPANVHLMVYPAPNPEEDIGVTRRAKIIFTLVGVMGLGTVMLLLFMFWAIYHRIMN